MNGRCDCCGAPVADWDRENCAKCDDEITRGKHHPLACAEQKRHRDGMRRGKDVVDKPPPDLPEKWRDFLAGK